MKGGIQDRRDVEQERFLAGEKGGMQDRRDAEQERCCTEGKERWDAGQEGCRTGEMLYRRDRKRLDA